MSSENRVENIILGELQVKDIANSRVFAEQNKLDYNEFVSSLKRLEGFDMVAAKVEQEDRIALTAEAQEYVKCGASMEVLLLNEVTKEGLSKGDLTVCCCVCCVKKLFYSHFVLYIKYFYNFIATE